MRQPLTYHNDGSIVINITNIDQMTKSFLFVYLMYYLIWGIGTFFLN